MGNLVFGIENSLNEVLSFNVVDGHGYFNDVARVDDQLLGVREDAQQSVVYDREEDIVAVDVFYLLPGGLFHVGDTWGTWVYSLDYVVAQ